MTRSTACAVTVPCNKEVVSTCHSTKRYPQDNLKKEDTNKLLSLEEQRQLVVTHFIDGKQMAAAMLKKWGAYLEEQELDSIVGLSLCEAASHFKPKLGVRFTSFLYYYLKGNLIRSIVEKKRSNGNNIQEHNDCSSYVKHTSTVHAELCLGNLAANSEVPYFSLFRQQIVTKLSSAISHLNQSEQKVIKGIYIDGTRATVLADQLQVSRSYVSEIKARALRKLREELKQAV